MPVYQRHMGYLVAQNDRLALQRLVTAMEEQGDLPLLVQSDKVVARFPSVDDSERSLPESVLVLADHELRWEAHLGGVTWREDELLLRGFALIQNAPTMGNFTRLTGRLVEVGQGVPADQVELEVLSEQHPRLLNGRKNYADCGFSCTIDISGLAARRPGVRTTWRVQFERRVEMIHRTGGITTLDAHVNRGWRLVDLPETPDRARARVRARLRRIDEDLAVEIAPA